MIMQIVYTNAYGQDRYFLYDTSIIKTEEDIRKNINLTDMGQVVYGCANLSVMEYNLIYKAFKENKGKKQK